MIQMQTMLNIADNSGAKTARCIKVLGGTHRRTAGIGDTVVVSIQKAIPGGAVKSGQVARAVVVRTRIDAVFPRREYQGYSLIHRSLDRGTDRRPRRRYAAFGLN